MTLIFNEGELRLALGNLQSRLVQAFAAAASSRLAQIIAKSSDYPQETQRAILNAQRLIWKAISLGSPIDTDFDEEQLTSLMQEEDEGPSLREALLEDAIMATVYTSASLKESVVDNAIWAIRRAYETADRFASNLLNDDTYSESAEQFIKSHPMVQSELMSQYEDINLLQRHNLPIEKNINDLYSRYLA